MDDDFKKSLINSDIFGAFINDRCMGIAGFFISASHKISHRGLLFALYVRKENRRKGVADQLLKAVIQHARQKVFQLHCTVNLENKSAFNLYQKHGFQVYGTTPRALKLGAKFHDEYLMVLKLK